MNRTNTNPLLIILEAVRMKTTRKCNKICRSRSYDNAKIYTFFKNLYRTLSQITNDVPSTATKLQRFCTRTRTKMQ